jgi:RNA polymerase sigma-B factor
VQELRLDIRKATGELTQQLARSPRDGELARYLRVSEADVRDAQRADQAFQAYSLDARLPGADGSCSFADVFGDDDPQIQQIIDMESVRAHWGELSRRERRLLARALGYLRQRIMESAQPCAGR